MKPSWPRVKLEALCSDPDDIRCGPFGTQLSNSEFQHEGVPLWGIRNVNQGFRLATKEFLSHQKAHELRVYSLQGGDLVMTRKGTIGNCALYPDYFPQGIMHSDLLRIRVNPRLCNPTYLVHILHSSPDVAHQVSLISSGAIMAGINVGLLRSVEIPLPDLPTQHRIAALLTRADRLRRLRRHALEMCEEVLGSLFRHEFSEASLAGKSVVRGSLSEFAEVQGGIQLSASRNAYPLQRPYLRVANVQRASLALDEIKMIGLTPQEFIRTKLEKNDILLVEGNGNPAEVGRAARWNDEVPDCVHQNHLIRVRANPKFLNPVFLLHLLNSETCREYFLREGNTTSGLVTISTGLVNDLPAIVPPLPLQQKFATLATRHDRLRRQHAESLRQAEHLFQTLLHQAFQPVA